MLADVGTDGETVATGVRAEGEVVVADHLDDVVAVLHGHCQHAVA